MRKRILITGGAGFIGANLCERFVREGYEVIAMDNLITGDLQNIEHLYPLENFEFYYQDVTDFMHIPGPLDYILHFASPSCTADYLKMPVQCLKSGFLGLHNSMGLAKAKGARILVASSADVYGALPDHPVSEEYRGNINHLEPEGVYNEDMRYLESITQTYRAFYQVDTRIARIFPTYGPHMRLSGEQQPTDFIGQALKGDSITIPGDKYYYQSLCYVDDIVEGVYRLLMSDYHLPINLGNPEGVNITGLAEELFELTGRKKKATFNYLKPDNTTPQPLPDITRARQLLGWEPVISHGEGLLNMYQYFKNESVKQWPNRLQEASATTAQENW